MNWHSSFAKIYRLSAAGPDEWTITSPTLSPLESSLHDGAFNKPVAGPFTGRPATPPILNERDTSVCCRQRMYPLFHLSWPTGSTLRTSRYFCQRTNRDRFRIDGFSAFVDRLSCSGARLLGPLGFNRL
jgi:hypothetical protein